MKKLYGRISVVIDAENFIEAGDHQKTLESLLQIVREKYPEASLDLTQRRERKPLGLRSEAAPAIQFERYRAG
jgi:hypothetical protein